MLQRYLVFYLLLCALAVVAPTYDARVVHADDVIVPQCETGGDLLDGGIGRRTLLADTSFTEGFGAAFIYGKREAGGTIRSYREIAPWQVHLKPEGEWITETTGDRLDDETAGALAFIERNHAKPFFLYLAYSGPHTPLAATAERLARFPGEMPERRRTALAMIATMDDGVGRVMEALRKHGLEENTLIVFTSDNGAPLKMTMTDAPMTSGPDGKQIEVGGWDGSMNEPHLGEKGMLTEGGIREPFLWSWRGVLPAGKVYDHPISSLDIAATVLDAAGIDDNRDLDGVNVLPHLKGEVSTPPHDALYWRFWKQAAIRAGDWKLIHLGDGTDFLFDLTQPDPETKNLAADHPEKVTELRNKLEAWTQQLRPPGLPKNGIQRERQWYQHYLQHPVAAKP